LANWVSCVEALNQDDSTIILVIMAYVLQ